MSFSINPDGAHGGRERGYQTSAGEDDLPVGGKVAACQHLLANGKYGFPNVIFTVKLRSWEMGVSDINYILISKLFLRNTHGFLKVIFVLLPLKSH